MNELREYKELNEIGSEQDMKELYKTMQILKNQTKILDMKYSVEKLTNLERIEGKIDLRNVW